MAEGTSSQPQWKQGVWESSQVTPAVQRPPVVVAIFLLLWALNVYIFDKNRLNHTSVLPGMKVASQSFLVLAPLCLILVYLACDAVLQGVLSSESIVCLFYALVGAGIFVITQTSVSMSLVNMVREQVVPFLQLLQLVFSPALNVAPSFPEVLLADALCSLSKVFKDIGITLVVMYSKVWQSPAVEAHDGAMVLVALLASLPFALRTRQCSIQLLAASDWNAGIPICINIVKYVSSLFPIWLAAAASLGLHHKQLPNLVLIFACINSTISFGWDIVMDWGLISFRRKTGHFTSKIPLQCYVRPRLLIPVYFHIAALVINLVLRFSWTATMVPALAHWDSASLVLLVELAEVLRRAMWNVFRVEWEIIARQDADTQAASPDDGADKSLLKD